MQGGHTLRLLRGIMMAMHLRRIAIMAIAASVCAGAAIVILRPDSTATMANDAVTETAIATGGAQGDPAPLLPQLAAHLQKYPRDARAWALYARLRFSRGEYAEASTAYARAVESPGKVARDPLVWCEYADALALANGGHLAGKPRELIEHALALDGKNPRALEMAGSAEIEQGNFAAALRYWEELLTILPPDLPAYRELAIAVERTRMRAGR